jgi:AcrR family transcriptional regulator
MNFAIGRSAAAGGKLQLIHIPASMQPRRDVARRGRPRRLETDAAILDAAATLLAQGGYVRLSIEQLAIKAGVGKTTVYRRWRSKRDLVIDLLGLIGEMNPIDDTGDIRADLTSFCERLLSGRSLAGPRASILPAMIAESVHNAEIAEIFRKTYFRPRRDAAAVVIRAAKERGAIRADVDELALVDMLAGLVWYRRLTLGLQLSGDDAAQIASILLDGALARPAPP